MSISIKSGIKPGCAWALDTASGLLVLPVVPDTTNLPIVVYAHGTTDGPADVPSKLHGGYEVAMAYAAKGFAVAAPDFLGLGDARGFHPYVHAASKLQPHLICSMHQLNTWK
jgi:hypothetical protein